jgi:hypothetical protein
VTTLINVTTVLLLWLTLAVALGLVLGRWLREGGR